MDEKEKTTIERIAKLAGVSKSTVSRVVSNNVNVSDKTRKKVLAIMDGINYKPNMMAQGLATGRLNMIALVVSDIRNPFFAELVSAINASLQSRGYLVTLFSCGPDDNMFHRIMSYGYSGVIIADALNDENFGAIIRSADCPVVLVNRDSDILADYDTVMVDNRLGGYLAAKHLLELGHRRIAMLRGPLDSTASGDRYRGYAKALTEFGVNPATQFLMSGDFTMRAGELFAAELFDRPEPPCTAAFIGSDNMALGFLGACKDRGVRVPEDISLVGFDCIPITQMPLIRLTSIEQPCRKIAELTTDKLLARINGADLYAEKVTLMPRLRIGRTTRKLEP